MTIEIVCPSVRATAGTRVGRGRGTFVLRTRRNVAARAVLTGGGRRPRGAGGTFTRRQLRNALRAARPQTIR
jgi:hypothetical protein